MLPEAIELIVVTPERELLRETVVEVTIPGARGKAPGIERYKYRLGPGDRGAAAGPDSDPDRQEAPGCSGGRALGSQNSASCQKKHPSR